MSKNDKIYIYEPPFTIPNFFIHMTFLVPKFRTFFRALFWRLPIFYCLRLMVEWELITVDRKHILALGR